MSRSRKIANESSHWKQEPYEREQRSKSNLKRTKETDFRQNPLLKKGRKIVNKDIDIFAQKRPSELDSSIYSIKQDIKQLQDRQMKLFELSVKVNNQKIINELAQALKYIRHKLKNLERQLYLQKPQFSCSQKPALSGRTIVL